MKNNKIWYLACIIGFLPLLLYHLTIPIYQLNLRPFNGNKYYYLVILLGVVTLGGIAFCTWVLSNKVKEKKHKKVIYGILIVYSLFTISNRISYLRKERHLKEYGTIQTVKIAKQEDVAYGVRIYFNYSSDDSQYKGALEYRREEIEIYSEQIRIVVSAKDPRVYDINYRIE
jgi:hypothetical protein